MPRKPKFRPRIKRIKLTPEQAVLACACYSRGMLDVQACLSKGPGGPFPFTGLS